MTIFKLPDLGEGLPDAEIAEWHVKVGDVVQLDQSLVSMETAKAVVEVPSPFAGLVVKLYGNKGDIIQTGSPLIEFEAGAANASTVVLPTAVTAPLAQTPAVENASLATNAAITAAKAAAVSGVAEDAATVAGKLEVGGSLFTETATSVSPAHRMQGGGNTFAAAALSPKATPAIRALAQRLKVDLSTIAPSGPNQTITTQDVENAAKVLHAAGPLEPLRGTRRIMAQIMSQSHLEVVPVTIMEDAKLFRWSDNEDVTVRLIQAMVVAAQKEPSLNAWYDSKAMGRRLMKEVHLGLAVDTPDGLFVPVIRNAETLSALELRKRVDELKKQVFDRTIAPEDLKGATVILSNFGKYAGRYANPIVVPPMVAILGAGKVRPEVIAENGAPKVSQVLPLALTFDHRAVTGGESTRFLGAVIEALEQAKV